jgi:lysophospholipid acyltransferase (LPLAT)-like uncharacterized protein
VAHARWLVAGAAVGAFLRAWRMTLRSEVRNQAARDQRCVVAVWHGRFVGVLLENFDSRLITMASLSADGAFAAGACRMVGLRVARGSGSRGGRAALDVMSDALAAGAPAAGLTVDGPKGPWRQVKPGAVALALRHQLPLVPATFSSRRVVALRSWDHMVLPRPFTRSVVMYGEPWTPDQLRKDPEGALVEVGERLDHMCRELDLEIAGRELWPDRPGVAAAS